MVKEEAVRGVGGPDGHPGDRKGVVPRGTNLPLDDTASQPGLCELRTA